MVEKVKMNIVFTLAGGADWSAGAIFYGTVIGALRSVGPELCPKIAFIVQDEPGGQMQHSELLALADAVITFNPSPHSLTRVGRVLKNYANKLNSPMDKALKEFGADVLVTTHLPDHWALPQTPVISWIPDFQHKRMPELFSKEEITARDLQFLYLVQNSKKLIVTSRDVQDDASRFYPETKDRCHVLKFAAQIPEEMLQQDPAEIAALYNLPPKFFCLPNQFWKHKNHLLVLESLARALSKRPGLTIVATGSMRDYRHSNFMDELMQEVSKLGLRNNFIVLGLIPRAHMFGLIRRSIALLQPSLFEGLGMTVAEACVLGKQVIASDIAVLKELAPPSTLFFDPHDAEQLAGILVEQDIAAEAESFEAVADTKFQAARKIAPQMLREFGQSVLNAMS